MVTRRPTLELAGHGIRVNTVGPDQLATEFAEDYSEGAERAASDDHS